MKSVFISYSWNDSRIADTLDILFSSKEIILQRDIRDIDYKESIKEYMMKVRDADYCLMLISESYLKSKNCMYEVLEFIKDPNYFDKILPFIIGKIKIFDAENRALYVKYWENEFYRVDSLRETVNVLNQVDLLKELKMIDNIQKNISEFLEIIATHKIEIVKENISIGQFLKIYSIIDPGNEDKTITNIEGYFIANVPRSIYHRIFTWWRFDSEHYTEDISEAKIFTKEEIIERFVTSRQSEWENKKYVAIPINSVASEFKQNVVPFISRFINQIENKKNQLYGNTELYLSEEEIKYYG